MVICICSGSQTGRLSFRGLPQNDILPFVWVFCLLFVWFFLAQCAHPSKTTSTGPGSQGSDGSQGSPNRTHPPSSHTHTNTHLHFYLLFKHFKNHLPLASRGAASAASVVGNVLSSKRGSRDGEGDLPASKPGTVRQPPQ